MTRSRVIGAVVAAVLASTLVAASPASAASGARPVGVPTASKHLVKGEGPFRDYMACMDARSVHQARYEYVTQCEYKNGVYRFWYTSY